MSPQAFTEFLLNKDVRFFAGVPDSLLKDFCGYVADHLNEKQHVITANEGSAIALASGFHLATGKIPAVYMQNSGFGNALNPLLSLADPEVYSVPMLVIVGWRGEPGAKDEPQHIKQGRVMEALCQSLELPVAVIDKDLEMAKKKTASLLERAKEQGRPVVLLVKKNSFETYSYQKELRKDLPLQREQVIDEILNHLGAEDVVIATTGKTSRELFEVRKKRGEAKRADFLTVGSMGHASQIAAGVALYQPERQVYCLDGDGALLMHMGSAATLPSLGLRNFKHIILNNGAHESVGGQPTVGFSINIPAVLSTFGYGWVDQAQDKKSLSEKLQVLKEAKGPAALEVQVQVGSRSDLGRPTSTPLENKKAFIEALGLGGACDS